MYLAHLALFCVLVAAEPPEPGEFATPVEAAAPEEEAEMSVRRSSLSISPSSLGCFYGVAIPLAGLAVFVGACLVVALSKRPALIASYLVFLPLPLLIGMCGSIQGMSASLSVIAMSSTAPRPSDIALGISMALFSSYVGLLVSVPSYLVLSIGLFVRTLQAGKSPFPFGSSILP